MTKKKGLHYFFLRHKPVKLLINLNKDEKLRYASKLSKEADCTYSHTVRILNKLKENKLVQFKKRGRLKLIQLTPSGKEIAKNLSKTISLFNKAEDD